MAVLLDGPAWARRAHGRRPRRAAGRGARRACCAGRRSSGCGCRRGWPTRAAVRRPAGRRRSTRCRSAPVAGADPAPDGGGRVVQGRGGAALGGDRRWRCRAAARARRRSRAAAEAGRAGRRWTARRRSCRGSRSPPARSRCSTSCRRRRRRGRCAGCCTAGIKAEGPIHVDRLAKLTVGRVRAEPGRPRRASRRCCRCCRRRPWSTTTCGPRASTRRRGRASAGRLSSTDRPIDHVAPEEIAQRDGGAVPGVGRDARATSCSPRPRRCSATSAGRRP